MPPPHADELGFTDDPRCPYCMRELPDPDQGTTHNGLYEVLCVCGAWLELLRHVEVEFRIRQCSPTVPPRVYLGTHPLDAGECDPEDLGELDPDTAPGTGAHQSGEWRKVMVPK